jgi:hypothetical protein
MNIPGFSAETSIYKGVGRYYATGLLNRARPTGGGIRLAQGTCVCMDQNCNDCQTNCGDPSDCFGAGLDPGEVQTCVNGINACKNQCCLPSCSPCTQTCQYPDGATRTQPC